MQPENSGIVWSLYWYGRILTITVPGAGAFRRDFSFVEDGQPFPAAPQWACEEYGRGYLAGRLVVPGHHETKKWKACPLGDWVAACEALGVNPHTGGLPRE